MKVESTTDDTSQNFETQKNLEIAPFQTNDLSVKAKIGFNKYKKIIILAGVTLLILVAIPVVQKIVNEKVPALLPKTTPTPVPPTPTPAPIHLQDAELDAIYQSILQIDNDLEKVDLKETGLKTPELEKDIRF